MSKKKMSFDGVEYEVDPGKSQILSRTSLDVYEEGAPNEWVLVESLLFYSHRIDKICKIPKFFITDLASIPSLARILIEVNGKHRYAAIIHDYLYAGNRFGLDKVSREVCDKILADFCKEAGVSGWKVLSIYLAVRVGGWWSYQKGQSSRILPRKLWKKYTRRTAGVGNG